MRHKLLTRRRAVILLVVELGQGAELAAQVDVSHDALVAEVGADVAGRVGEVG